RARHHDHRDVLCRRARLQRQREQLFDFDRDPMKRLTLVLLLAACGPEAARPPGVTGLEGLALTDLQPGTWLPGTHVVVTGHAFVDPSLGSARLRLLGTVDGTALDLEVPVHYVDAQHLDFDAAPQTFGHFTGQVILTFDSLVDGRA